MAIKMSDVKAGAQKAMNVTGDALNATGRGIASAGRGVGKAASAIGSAAKAVDDKFDITGRQTYNIRRNATHNDGRAINTTRK